MEPGALILLAFLAGIIFGVVFVLFVRHRTASLFVTNPLFAIGRLNEVRTCVLAYGDWRDGSPSDVAMYHLGRVETHLRDLSRRHSPVKRVAK